MKKFLEAIGVNTTQLQWRLYEREKARAAERERRAAGEKKPLPSWLRWWSYQHKFCPHCDTLVAADDRTCASCGSRLPSMAAYKFRRVLGLVFPQGHLAVTLTFIPVMLGIYALSIKMQGPSAIMSPSNLTSLRFGSLWGPFVRNGEYWRLMTCGLFHFGLLHIGFNTMALSQVGPRMEETLGPKRMLVLVTLTQLTSALACTIFTPRAIVAGASGWIFGLIGFGVTYFHRAGGSHHQTRNFFFQWAMYAFFIGLFIRASTAGHLGGLFGGAALGLTADVSLARKTIWTRVWDGLFWPSLALWTWALIQLARSIF